YSTKTESEWSTRSCACSRRRSPLSSVAARAGPGVRDDKSGLVLREIHQPPQFLEAWLAAQGLERTKYPDPRHPAKAELETSFQPSQCLILFPQGCVDFGQTPSIHRRDLLFQFGGHL